MGGGSGSGGSGNSVDVFEKKKSDEEYLADICSEGLSQLSP